MDLAALNKRSIEGIWLLGNITTWEYAFLSINPTIQLRGQKKRRGYGGVPVSPSPPFPRVST